MSYDLTNLLRDWPYEPGQLAVRVIEGDDGRSKIQIRLDLGLLQLEMDGRPDGLRPHGYESLLEYYEDQLDQAEQTDQPDQTAAENDPDSDSEAEAENETVGLTLDENDCRALREEAVQYYHRYVALFVLDEYEGVLRDTSRNLRVLDLCAAHAQRDEDRDVLEQFRPYILMMRARALAGLALRDNETKAAVMALEDGVEQIREYFESTGQPEAFEQCNEVELLRGLKESLAPKLPVSQSSELRDRLRQAIEQENYELAAILRDELKMISDV